jgi:serine protease Do
MIRDVCLFSLTALAGLGLLVNVTRADDSLDDLQEKAIKASVKKVAVTIVKIETSGGTEVIKGGPKTPPKGPAPKGPLIRRGTGPTTGVVVSEDGYVITSAFNFANNPATIRIALPGLKERRVAHVVATDETRMLTLLKIVDLPKDTKLTVPKAAKKADVEIGQTAIAVGRTLAAETDGAPSVSVGIISAVNRIWGKALQTDAKVSPVNYGGPLIDLEGNVQGILVPASPQAEGQTAGFEWYDSGIGFAIPLEDVYAVLPRMKKGSEKEPVVLKRGFMGVTMRSTDMFEAQPIVGTVAPGTAADKAGIKPGDLVKSIDGKAVANYAELLHQTGSKYEGDTISMVVERDKKEVKFEKVVLGSPEQAFPQAFLGILPLRDDPDPGVEIRYVYPKSPADVATLKAGDRIMKVASPAAAPNTPPIAITRGRDQLMSLLETGRPGLELSVEVKRKAGGKTETVKVKLGELPETVPTEKELPETASAKKALTKPGEKAPPKKADKKPDTGLMKKQTPALDHTYHVYVPDTYDPNIACSVMIWLHPLNKNKEKDIEDFVSSWTSYADDKNVIILCPVSDNARGWTPGDAEWIGQAVRTIATTYTLDMRRVVAHGMGQGGEMALYVGFQSRTLIRGVATVGAALGSNPREKVVNEPLSFFLVTGGKDPNKGNVVATKEKLQKFKYPTIFREVTNMGVEYVDGKAGVPTLEELVRWIDTLDRM